MNKQAIKHLLQKGCNIDYKDVSISFLKGRHGGWQVYAEHRKLEPVSKTHKKIIPKKEKGYVFDHCFSIIYDDIEDAVDKFISLTKFLYE